MKVTVEGVSRNCQTVEFDAPRNEVVLIEQRLLPHSFEIIRTKDFRETARAITDMIVRGAGAIGATAAFGFAQGVRAFRETDLARFDLHSTFVADVLQNARPTAVDPANAIRQMKLAMEQGKTVPEKQQIALVE